MLAADPIVLLDIRALMFCNVEYSYVTQSQGVNNKSDYYNLGSFQHKKQGFGEVIPKTV